MSRDRILVVGGYGKVGQIISKRLSEKYPKKVLIAGRNLSKAENIIFEMDLNAEAIELDISSNTFDTINFSQIHTVISCIDFLKHDHFLLACIENQLNYIELATSYDAYLRMHNYKLAVDKNKVCLVPGVGLLPGMSALFVKEALKSYPFLDDVHTYVLLSLGDRHGTEAIRWMLEYACKPYRLKHDSGFENLHPFVNSTKVTLVGEKAARRFYPFNFGDQHIIAETMKTKMAKTWLTFDQNYVATFLSIIKRIGLLSFLYKSMPRFLIACFGRMTFGSERFSVQTVCSYKNKKKIFNISGKGEANATGIIASFIADKIYNSNDKSGIVRIEDTVDFKELLDFLHKNNIKIKGECYE